MKTDALKVTALDTQVYRGMLPPAPGHQPQQVAVKIRHPNVVEYLNADFVLLKAGAAAVECIPSLRGLGIGDSVAQFSNSMTAQADLRVEAAHLERFCNSFQHIADKARSPYLSPTMCRLTQARTPCRIQ